MTAAAKVADTDFARVHTRRRAAPRQLSDLTIDDAFGRSAAMAAPCALVVSRCQVLRAKGAYYQIFRCSAGFPPPVLSFNKALSRFSHDLLLVPRTH